MATPAHRLGVAWCRDRRQIDSAGGRVSRSYTGRMESKRAWAVYTVIRVLAFALPFALVMVALPTWQWNWLLGAILGSVVGLAVSYIFLRRQRDAIAGDLAAMKERRDTRMVLDKEEDAALDGHDDVGDDAVDEPRTEASGPASTQDAEPDSERVDEARAESSDEHVRDDETTTTPKADNSNR